jgi:hypothetical protein
MHYSSIILPTPLIAMLAPPLQEIEVERGKRGKDKKRKKINK